MLVTTPISIDLVRKNFTQFLYATQDDGNTRAIEVTVTVNDKPWVVPEGTVGAVSFKKPDKTSGLYDTLPDGVTKAVTFSENKVTAILAPQVLTVAGDTTVSIALYDDSLNRLGIFPFVLRVERNPSAGQAISNDYYNFTTLAALNNAIGDLTQLQTANKNSLVTAINELKQDSAAAIIPSYWEPHLDEKIAAIKLLQRAGGKDCFSFVVITDYHRYSNIGRRSPVLIKHVTEKCGIKFCLCLGDTQNQGPWSTKVQALAEWDAIENEFSPIRNRTLMIPGNHDGAYGSSDVNGDGVISGPTDYYIYNLSPETMYDLVYRKVGLIPGVTFDESYNGYYVDDPVSKVRYILINTHYSDGAVNEDGTAVNNYMRKTRVGQPQVDMVVGALQSVPGDGWSVVIGMHIPLATVHNSGPSDDMILLRDVLEAYQEKTAYSSTFGTSGAYDYISVDVDFSTAKGLVAGVFCGHVHTDGSNDAYAFPIITSMSDDTSTAIIGGVTVPGQAGTVTEQSFDVFTVNKKTGVVYATKVGYGEDRVFGAVMVNPLDNADVILGSPNADKQKLDYYVESGIKQATLNPVFFYVEAGNTLKVSLSDYSGYRFAVHRYSCGESDRDTDFTVTEGTSKAFDVPSAKVYDSGWQNTDFSMEIPESCAVAFVFRSTAYSVLTDADTAAIRALLTATVTPTV